MASYDLIPHEMRSYKQWVCWRLEERPGAPKPTKCPYSPWPNGWQASVTNPASWGTFEQAVQAPNGFDGVVPWDYENNKPALPVSQTGFNGVGFVFSKEDEFSGIDLDDTHGDVEAYQRQLRVFQEFNSYTELSPSGKGVHIIVKGKLPRGRRRASIELYPHERFFTMTGNVVNAAPIAERQELLELLYEQMGGDVKEYVVAEDKEQRQTDEEVIAAASTASNGDKFNSLWAGNWTTLYPSQSEADFALVDIIAFYTQNKAQIARLFRQSMLGQRDKANDRHSDRYISYMVEKSFDRQLPPVDVEGMRQKLQAMIDARGGATGEPGGTPAAPTNVSDQQGKTIAVGAATLPSRQPEVNPFPPGLLGEVAQFFLSAAPRPVPEIALAGAIAYLAGLTGRAYNVSGTGTNQYVLFLAPTGVGKDAVAGGVSKLNNAIMQTVPSIVDFKGPGELVSSAGLIKWLDRKPCVLSILGEFGKKMKEMAAPNANAHLHGLSRVLLQMYSKSGHGEVFDPMAYSDKEKNTNSIPSPSLTILGESVPESFYESLDETLIADGLLPRFMVFEYKGDRAYLNKRAKDALPPFSLVQNLANLTAACVTIMHQRSVHDVKLMPDAEAKFDEFDRYTTDLINNSAEVPRQLWNRAHLKALKLAAIRAIGENWVEPVITLEHCMWATALIVEQTTKLVAKFETGMIGQVGGSEAKQLGEVIKVIASYLHSEYDRFSKYGGSFEMHRDGVITESHISRRLMCMACFRNDRMGATNAIKRSIKTLLEADELREMPPSQMTANYGNKPRAYVVSNPARFMHQVD
jgi:hypothetical protein